MDGFVDQALLLWDEVVVWVTSEPVLFWIVWITLALVLAAAAYFAWHLVKTVRAFNSIDIVETIRGPKPKRARTIQKRIDRARAFANSTLFSLSRQTGLLIFSGIVVPGVVMASIAVHQDWLLPGPPALIADSAEFGVGVVPYADVAIFISDQALRGALSDTFEVFDLSLGSITNNPDNTIFSGLVLFYRLLCALAAAALVYVFISVMRAQPHMREYIRDLERQLEQASR